MKKVILLTSHDFKCVLYYIVLAVKQNIKHSS